MGCVQSQHRIPVCIDLFHRKDDVVHNQMVHDEVKELALLLQDAKNAITSMHNESNRFVEKVKAVTRRIPVNNDTALSKVPVLDKDILNQYLDMDPTAVSLDINKLVKTCEFIRSALGRQDLSVENFPEVVALLSASIQYLAYKEGRETDERMIQAYMCCEKHRHHIMYDKEGMEEIIVAIENLK